MGNQVIRGERILIELLAIGTSDGQFTPIDEKRIIAIPERHLVEEAMCDSLITESR